MCGQQDTEDVSGQSCEFISVHIIIVNVFWKTDQIVTFSISRITFINIGLNETSCCFNTITLSLYNQATHLIAIHSRPYNRDWLDFMTFGTFLLRWALILGQPSKEVGNWRGEGGWWIGSGEGGWWKNIPYCIYRVGVVTFKK